MYRINKRTSHITVVVAEKNKEAGIWGQKVNPHGLRVGVIKNWIPAGTPGTTKSAIS